MNEETKEILRKLTPILIVGAVIALTVFFGPGTAAVLSFPGHAYTYSIAGWEFSVLIVGAFTLAWSSLLVMLQMGTGLYKGISRGIKEARQQKIPEQQASE